MNIDVEVSPEGWGNGVSTDIRLVCMSAASAFAPAIEELPVEPILVRPGADGPIALYERTRDGRIVIELSARDTYWAQYAYQFAHEFCHVLCNIGTHPAQFHRSCLWIEESLCEAASLTAIRSMAIAWQHAPPYPHWRDFSVALRDYGDRLLRPSPQPSFSSWLARELQALAANAYIRDKNSIIAQHLLPILEAEPSTWRAVRYVNRGPRAKDATEYFGMWRASAPPAYHIYIARLQECLTAKCGCSAVVPIDREKGKG